VREQARRARVLAEQLIQTAGVTIERLGLAAYASDGDATLVSAPLGHRQQQLAAE